jgi:hypothetical protein
MPTELTWDKNGLSLDTIDHRPHRIKINCLIIKSYICTYLYLHSKLAATTMSADRANTLDKASDPSACETLFLTDVSV